MSDFLANGMNWILSSMDGYILPLTKATSITLSLAFISLIVGMFFAFIFTILESIPFKPVAWLMSLFNLTIRALPELLIVVAIYTGLPLLLMALDDGFSISLGFTSFTLQMNIENTKPDPFLCGVIALSLLYAVYASQTLRGAFKAISSGQKQAAQVLGLSKSRTFFRIILPQMWRHALPGLSNQWLILLKDTALVSAIAIDDLMMQTKTIIARTNQPFLWYFIAMIIYLVISILSQKVIGRIEKRSTYFEQSNSANNQ
ncbi:MULTISPECIES: arginine ABC transporter permease ArtQ [unclassified Gilliamella]|uniref:arginine ABC transporter permease ArtQ n=1 Tax=unclassified Gilliamella TaxID=2685620 RepID=UPI00226A244F|nr:MULTISPECIES: arginine ABC transporter permease ArtQ [unclassified Gilliamella]MCX8642445.1 arginine ABC transporter permease ArtQ [Gilliamella sp. B3835]MCX8706295.1 arginine ABC transporter permease ArtQ [Gilliamella sp. B3783]MCX8709513.1 arginine ABC transporter permease ArtQ [Gilliamella sp. B3780]MCX8714346.1 arginine ABC transporter permease ArtQ [Gilliamella sp. B3781]MCX8717027.1 arginine ABC transporter permease ArtQ [Gilliamella sp. B3784]